ncbi:hypothetical protein DL93DRAFT_765029 [Clavulina sp. PMI_390]|nr:hypothetical protein DL93DRAFT_765029 [Clavulina sp. PMI_390]
MKNTTQGPQITSSFGTSTRNPSSARSRLQRIYNVKHRIYANDETICARGISTPVPKCNFNDYIAMALTSGGEALVIWMLSELLVIDMCHGHQLILRISREGDERPTNTKLAVMMCEYRGSLGVLIIGTFIQDTRLLFLFQALPGARSPQTPDVQRYIVLARFAIPLADRITLVEISRHYVIVGSTFQDPGGITRYYVQALDLQGETDLHASHIHQIQRVYLSGNRLVICFNNGDVGEHRVELLGSERFVTRSYNSHHISNRTTHIFCDPLYHVATQDGRIPISRDLKCWTISPHIVHETTPLRFDLWIVKFNLTADRPISVASPSSDPRSDFRLRPPHFPPALRSTTSSLSRLAPLRLHRDYPMVPQRWATGKSTLLTQLHIQDPFSDMLLLTYASPPKGSVAKNARGAWSTKYKPIRTYASDGTPTSFTSSSLGFVVDLLWNEYTGQIVTATRAAGASSNADLQIRIFEI